MPAFLEARLKREAAEKGLKGKAAARYTFGTLNNMGAMKGSAITAKGKAMDAKHAKDARSHKGKAVARAKVAQSFGKLMGRG